MATEIKVPALGESVSEATIAQWLKKVGDTVAVDEPLCELETDKVTVEVNATVAGVLADHSFNQGDTVEVGTVIGHIEEGASAAAPKPARAQRLLRQSRPPLRRVRWLPPRPRASWLPTRALIWPASPPAAPRAMC